MAIDIKFDLVGNPEPPTIILANRNGNKLGQLKVNTESIDLLGKFNDASEISFTVNKYIDDELTPLWDKLVDFKLVYCKEWDVWFEIKVELDEETESVKTVFCTQLGYAELSQVKLYDIEINTEKDIERDDYKITILYDPEDSGASLLDRMFEKAPHYSVIHVDSTIANIQRTFSFDDTSIADACQEVGEEIGCLFKFHSNSDEKGMPQRTVSVYDLQQNCEDCDYRGEFTDVCPKCGSTNIKYGYGDDTSIFVTSDELATNGIQLVTDTDAVKNCFKLEAGDDLMTATIRNCNPNGTDYIWYFSDSLKEDMSDELVERLESYDELYKQYYNENEYDISFEVPLFGSITTDSITVFNNIVDQYSEYNEDLQKITTPIKGYSSLMNAYYNVVDLAWYLKSGLMPTVKMSETNAKEQAGLLTASALSPVAVTDLKTVSLATANSAVMSMAKTIIRPTYKIQVNDSELVELDDEITKYWKGNFSITNYSDEEDTAISNVISIRLDDDLEAFVKQKIDKALDKEDTDDLSITGLFKKDGDDFENELTKYALVPLTSFRDACQTCIDILIEQGIGDKNTWGDTSEGAESNLYEKLYLPYYDKLNAIEKEMAARESTIDFIVGKYDLNGNLIRQGVQTKIEEHRNKIQKALNFQKYMGEKLWSEFCAYRREDKYSNDNYISDALNNAELFKRALEFYKVAENEIYKSAELQHSISSTLNNLLAIEKFKPLVKSFKVGNWLRVQVDEKIFKLRLLEYEIDFGNFDKIPVEFSDVTKIKNGVTDVESVLSQASSMASSYGALTRQVDRGDDARSTIREWLTEGLNTALVQIQNNVNEDIVIDKNGLLGRSYSDITEAYSPEQIKLTHNIIAYTDDDWKTVKQAIGKHKYVMYDANENAFVDKVGFGVSAEFVTAGIVSGSQIIGGDIYSDNYSVTKGIGSYINLRDGTFSFGGGSLRYSEDEGLIISSPNIPTKETITEINEKYLKTTTVYAENLKVGSANIQGQLIASQINTQGLIAENISGTTIEGKIISGGSLFIGDKESDSSTYAEITNAGVLSCSGANISGIINSIEGEIGGWTIDKDNINSTSPIEDYGGYVALFSREHLTKYNDAIFSIGASSISNDDDRFRIRADGRIRIGKKDERYSYLHESGFNLQYGNDTEFSISRGENSIVINGQMFYTTVISSNIKTDDGWEFFGKDIDYDINRILAIRPTGDIYAKQFYSNDPNCITGTDGNRFPGFTHYRKTKFDNTIEKTISVNLGCGIYKSSPTIGLEMREVGKSNIEARLEVYRSTGEAMVSIVGWKDGTTSNILELGKNLYFSGTVVCEGSEVSSTEAIKTNIRLADSALSLFEEGKSEVYSYNRIRKSEINNGYVDENTESDSGDITFTTQDVGQELIDIDETTSYGFVIGDGYLTPSEVLSSDGKHINLYSMASLNWKATQELYAMLLSAQAKIEELESKILGE